MNDDDDERGMSGQVIVYAAGSQSVRRRVGEAGLSGVSSVRDAEGADRPAAAARRRQQTGRRDDGRH